MDTVVILSFIALMLLAVVLTKIGDSRGWGVAPLGLLGLGFIVPLGMLLTGAL